MEEIKEYKKPMGNKKKKPPTKKVFSDDTISTFAVLFFITGFIVNVCLIVGALGSLFLG